MSGIYENTGKTLQGWLMSPEPQRTGGAWMGGESRNNFPGNKDREVRKGNTHPGVRGQGVVTLAQAGE